MTGRTAKQKEASFLKQRRTVLDNHGYRRKPRGWWLKEENYTVEELNEGYSSICKDIRERNMLRLKGEEVPPKCKNCSRVVAQKYADLKPKLRPKQPALTDSKQTKPKARKGTPKPKRNTPAQTKTKK